MNKKILLNNEQTLQKPQILFHKRDNRGVITKPTITNLNNTHIRMINDLTNSLAMSYESFDLSWQVTVNDQSQGRLVFGNPDSINIKAFENIDVLKIAIESAFLFKLMNEMQNSGFENNDTFHTAKAINVAAISLKIVLSLLSSCGNQDEIIAYYEQGTKLDREFADILKVAKNDGLLRSLDYILNSSFIKEKYPLNNSSINEIYTKEEVKKNFVAINRNIDRSYMKNIALNTAQLRDKNIPHNVCIMDISIGNILPVQHQVFGYKVETLKKDIDFVIDFIPIAVLRWKGKTYLIDGDSRVVAAGEAGKEKIKAVVIDIHDHVTECELVDGFENVRKHFNLSGIKSIKIIAGNEKNPGDVLNVGVVETEKTVSMLNMFRKGWD
ncbi:MAG: hypothetical protein ABIH39_04020 [Candidatus Margulisiibacteriota bacterium]